MISAQAPSRAFFGVSGLLVAGSTATTVLWCTAMPGGMPMPGGWTMSMVWMRMPGHSWASATASFLAMWVVMMAAMMLPAVTPTLWLYRENLARWRATSADRLTALAGLAYLAVWTVLGCAIFPPGVALAATEMREAAFARAVPMLAAIVVVIAGALQFTPWKTRQLACCDAAAQRDFPSSRTLPASASAALRYGLHLGLRCASCCAGLTAILLVIGVMDLRAMAMVTVAITAERRAPVGSGVARVGGLVIVGAGLILIAHAARN